MRLVLVKECGFYCSSDYRDDCDECSAKEYCEDYQHYFESEVSEDDL